MPRPTPVALALALLALPAAAQQPDAATLAFGRQVFTEIAAPACPICHTLADAGAEGAVGPDLDTLRPDAERVRAAVTRGIGPMRPYTALTADEVAALAAYVSTVAGR